MQTNSEQLDLEKLPEEARKELLDFYEFLVNKHKKQTEKKNRNILDKEIEELSWEMGQKLYKNRGELHER